MAAASNRSTTPVWLYIHRTTLIYRIERIRAISGLDLDSYPTRLYLSICFQLLAPAT